MTKVTKVTKATKMTKKTKKTTSLILAALMSGLVIQFDRLAFGQTPLVQFLSDGGKNVVTGQETKPVLADGQADGLSATDGIRVVVFLSARCPCSVSHETVLKDLYRDYSPRGVGFLGVHSNVDEDAAMTQEHFKASALPFAVIQDSEAKWADRFGALKTPHVYVYQGEQLMYQGGVDDSRVSTNAKRNYLKEALANLTQGKVPEVKEARALGCRIKRPD